MKITIFFLFFFSFLSLVNCSELKISPQELFFEGETNKFICKNISIETSEESTVIIQDRWAIKDFQEKDFKSHKLKREDLDLALTYNSSRRVIDLSNELICIKAKQAGFYHGLILLRIKDSSSGIGVWINLNISEKNFKTKVSDTILLKNKESSKLVSFVLFLLILILLIELIFYLKKKIYS